MSKLTLPSAPAGDGSCQGHGPCLHRRTFLKVGLEAAALAAVAAVMPDRAAALVSWIDATPSGGTLRYPVPAADGVSIDKGNELIVVRAGATAFAFALSCPHQRSMLRWREKDGIFQCSKHHSEYSPQGVYEKGRATRNMDRLAVHLEGTELVVDPGRVFKSDDDPEGWASAVVNLT